MYQLLQRLCIKTEMLAHQLIRSMPLKRNLHHPKVANPDLSEKLPTIIMHPAAVEEVNMELANIDGQLEMLMSSIVELQKRIEPVQTVAEN